ncbi:MAG: sugar phosphate isomerase/epimerase family protein [Armatimonadota bacterium]
MKKNKANLSLSTWDYLYLPPFKALDKISSMGFDSVELWGDYPHFWPRKYLIKDNLQKLKNKLKKFTGLNSVHAPIVRLTSKNAGLREEAIKQVKETILLAGKLGIKYITLHGGEKPFNMQNCNFTGQTYNLFINDLKKLGILAGRKSVILCLENIPGEFGFEAHEMKKLLSRVNSKGVCMTLDIGHANLAGGDKVFEFFKLLKNKIRVMHINDNDGSGDDHLAIGSGNIKFCEFFNKFGKDLENKVLVGELAYNKKNPEKPILGFINFMKNFTA